MADLSQPNVNPINPPLAKAIIQSFPTPNVEDVIYREIVDSQIGSYRVIPYGTPFNEVDHGPNPPSHPNHQLVYAGPADPSGRLVQRIWAAPREDSKEYDYSTTFVDQDPDYPTIVRTKVVKRSEWTPKAPLTPDEVNPTCLLISQEQLNQTEPPEINSLYVTVVEVYERVPGPVVTSTDFDTELNILVYTDRQSVLSSSVADPGANPLILELRETPRSKYTKQRITSYLQTLPAERVEYQTGRYPFPALLFDITLTVTELTANRNEVIWFPDLRAAPDAPAKFKITTSFSTSEPSNVTVYVLGKRDVAYRGISYQLGFSQVLTDAITVTADFTGDDRYGDLTESYTISATTPSATQYQNSVIGTWKIVGPANIKQWRGKIWVKQVTEVLMI